MACADRELALLLLAHEELPLLQKISTKAHLRRCPACHASYEKQRALSALIAVSLCGGDEKQWIPLRTRLNTGRSVPLFLLFLFLVPAAIALLWFAARGPVTVCPETAQEVPAKKTGLPQSVQIPCLRLPAHKKSLLPVKQYSAE